MDESCKLDEKFVYEINSLVEDCKYDVRVKAVNEIGQGIPSMSVTNIHTKDYKGYLFLMSQYDQKKIRFLF